MNTEYDITRDELYLFNQGKYYQSYDRFGAHTAKIDGKTGMMFTLWAPMAKRVCIIGTFNDWQDEDIYMDCLGNSGVWSKFVPDVGCGELYKYVIESSEGEKLFKADPYAFSSEVRPGTASKTADIDSYKWHDSKWLKDRMAVSHFKKPLNIYEVHLGSWRRPDSDKTGDDAPFYSYRELADLMVPYVKEMNYTHIELLPVTEHPFDGSWGYQATGYFAPTSRYGSPQDFMYFVDKFHENGIGIILDWVPGHFCRDSHGLGRFNGQMLYEGSDHKQWGTYKFNFNKGEIRGFLLSSAMMWLKKYHLDGLRVDGVSSMIYLNFGLDDDSPDRRLNRNGGEEDLDAVSFLQEFNTMVGSFFPDVFTIAEESSAWPMVTKPPRDGGLGFHYKWDMGWMNDTLKYFSKDFPYRPYEHNLLTFSTMYAYSENFILPLSHDEVVHGKCSLIGRMPGDYWRQFAGLRTLMLYQMCHTGAKLNFMGNEFGQFIEWRYYEQLEWFLLDYDSHRRHREFVKALNALFFGEKALWKDNYSYHGFSWIEADNNQQGVLIFQRQAPESGDRTVIVLNFQPGCFKKYRIGVPLPGTYNEILNSDDSAFGGSGKVNSGPLRSSDIPMHGQEHSVEITLPPLGGVILKKSKRGRQKKYY